MVIVTHESYDSVLVGTGKQKGLESLSETASDGADATWRGILFQTVAPETVIYLQHGGVVLCSFQ